jgi:hypothetical protein
VDMWITNQAPEPMIAVTNEPTDLPPIAVPIVWQEVRLQG